MEAVVDASVIIAVIVNEAQKPILINKTRDVDLIAPSSIHWEIGNAFSAMLKRQRITIQQALQAITTYQQIPLRFVDVELADSVKLAAELNLYAYDAYLLRCAVKYHAPLLTLDHQLSLAARKMSIKVLEIE